MKLRHILKIMKNYDWIIYINDISLDYNGYGFVCQYGIFEETYFARKGIISGLKKCRGKIEFFGTGKIPRLVKKAVRKGVGKII